MQQGGKMVHAEIAGQSAHCRAVARVFFDDTSSPREVRGLYLANHLANVAELAKQWDFDCAFGKDQYPQEVERTRGWLVAAAQRHDEGKPRRFRIRQDGHGTFTYSFAGHRFDVVDERPYVQWLIRLHHGFAVEDITEAQAWLKQSGDPELAVVAHVFPLDLYALEMCDQIEAEAATHVFTSTPSTPRAFMEFEVYPDRSRSDDGYTSLRIFPFPFRCEVGFRFESFVVAVPPVRPQGMQADEWLRELVTSGEMTAAESMEVRLCPLN